MFILVPINTTSVPADICQITTAALVWMCARTVSWFVLQKLINSVVLQQHAAAPFHFPCILFGSAELCRCWKESGLTPQRHLSVWVFCFRNETQSPALAVSWKPLNLVPKTIDQIDPIMILLVFPAFCLVHALINTSVWDDKSKDQLSTVARSWWAAVIGAEATHFYPRSISMFPFPCFVPFVLLSHQPLDRLRLSVGSESCTMLCCVFHTCSACL